MNPAGFVHLHVHTEYSLLDGAARIPQLARRAAELGMPALAMTDHGAMYGAVQFYKACTEAGVKPLVGCEVYVARRSRHDRTAGLDDDPYHLVLLAEDGRGYANLLRIVSRAYTEGFYYKPRVDDELLAEHSGGLVALSGCVAGKVPHLLLEGREEAAKEAAAAYRDIFGPSNFYLELQDNGLDSQRRVNGELLKLARDLGIPVVVTNDVHYINRADARAHDVLLCIQTGKSINDPDRLRFETDEFYLKTAGEMGQLFRDLPGALEETMRIAQRCNVSFEFGQLNLPEYSLPRGYDASGYLRKICHDRLPLRYPDPPEGVRDRLNYELDVIDKMGYAGYFLIVWDFVEYARANRIPVGPGRGSGAGSLVAYVLGITNLDPLKYDLLFERFLNPERVSMPDFDIDFCFERRGEVIDYVVSKYGSDCVAQIITFGTMAARAAIRDVGRALDMPYGEVDRVAKLVPAEVGVTLERALEASPELKEAYESDEAIRGLVDLARAVEGLPRHASTHAAGVVISGRPLIEHVPLQKTSEGSMVTQYPMEALEEIGLLKMDFLGLRTLTVIDTAIKIIERTTGERIDIDRIPLDDPATYRMLCEGNALGVFQLESGWVRDMLRELKPSRIDDLIAAVALCRPGPMENIPEYVKNKRDPASVKYLHPRLEPILRDTYGVLVYQEQIMKIAAEMAGFSLGQADLLRRAVGKKKREILDEQREAFVSGCIANGYDSQLAEQLYELILKFANYGFNKSHGAAYALVAYQTAYLKANYPVQFMAALLTSVVDSSDKVSLYIDECRQLGIRVLPPDVNESLSDFTVTGDGIRFGLAAVKNVGRGAVESIIAARSAGGPFRSLRDFCERVDTRLLNRRAIESLIKCGAFDSLGARRSQLMAALGGVMEAAQQASRRRIDGQLSFADVLDDGEGFLPESEILPDIEEYPQGRLLAMEKEALGFYISGHPLAHYEKDLRRLAAVQVGSLRDLPDGVPVTVGGIISARKRVTTRSGSQMAFLTLEDLTGSTEVLVFPKVLESCRDYLKEEAVVIVSGRVSLGGDEEAKVLADRIEPLVNREKVYVRIGGELPDQAKLEELRSVLSAHGGKSPVYLYIESQKKMILTNTRYWVEYSPELVGEIESLLGKGSVSVDS